MKKYKYIFAILFFPLFLFSCNQDKLAEQERIIDNLKSQISLVTNENHNLESQIAALEAEIEILKDTDQFYYQSGADEFS